MFSDFKHVYLSVQSPFSPFPHGTCLLSVLSPYLSLSLSLPLAPPLARSPSLSRALCLSLAASLSPSFSVVSPGRCVPAKHPDTRGHCSNTVSNVPSQEARPRGRVETPSSVAVQVGVSVSVRVADRNMGKGFYTLHRWMRRRCPQGYELHWKWLTNGSRRGGFLQARRRSRHAASYQRRAPLAA